MTVPHFVGLYHEHRIRIYKDDNEVPWLIVFDPLPYFDATTGQASDRQILPARERTVEAAMSTAEALAQDVYLSDLPIQKIAWRKLRDDCT